MFAITSDKWIFAGTNENIKNILNSSIRREILKATICTVSLAYMFTVTLKIQFISNYKSDIPSCRRHF